MTLKPLVLIALNVVTGCTPPSQPAASPTPARPTTVVDEGPMRVMTGAVLPAVHDLTPVRHHDPDGVVSFTLTMRRRKELPEPRPGQFITRDQMRAEYSATDDQVNVVKEWAARHHLNKAKVTNEPTASELDNELLVFQGTTRDIEETLRVTINDYRSASLGDFFANDRDPTIPATLPVSGFVGLNNARAAEPRGHSGQRSE
jgi:hypothetical protein